MASLTAYSISLGATDYPSKYSGLLAYLLPFLNNTETLAAALPVVTGASGYVSFVTNAAERMRIDSAGGIFAGATTTFPGFAARFSVGYEGGATRYGIALKPVADSTTVFAFLNAAGGGVGSITQTASTTAYNTTSDKRLKTGIVDAPGAGDDIDVVRVRSFDWMADGVHQKYGVIAQELAAVAPYAVHQPADPDQMMSVDYSKLVPMLIKEVQSLRTRIAAMESRP